MRMVLRPADRGSRQKLFSVYGVKSVVPLDICLGIDGLPCKMSIDMMLKGAFWAQNQCSYQLAEEAIKKVFGCMVNDDTIRQVTNFIGKLVFGLQTWHWRCSLMHSTSWICSIYNENVYDFAKAKFRQDASGYAAWSERICTLLEDGLWEEALSELDPGEKYENTVNLYHYIESNKEHMDYPKYKANGWFVGSGAIESGNKVVQQKRLKQAGMRWNPKTAQYLVTLCSKKESGRWEEDVENFIRKILSPGSELRNKILHSFQN